VSDVLEKKALGQYGIGGKRFSLMLFLFLISIFSASAYTTYNYDNFEDYAVNDNYTAIESVRRLAGLQDAYSLAFVDSNYNLFMQNVAGGVNPGLGFSNVHDYNPSACISLNDSSSGQPLNYSVRFRYRLLPQPVVPASAYLKVYAGSTGTGGINAHVPYFNVSMNASGSTCEQICRLNQALGRHECNNIDCYTMDFENYHTIQIDYYLKRNSTSNLNYAYDVFMTDIDLEMNGAYIGMVNEVNPVVCWNMTAFYWRTGGFTLDYIQTIVYSPGEAFVYPEPGSELITPYTDNGFPHFEIRTYDINHFATDSVRETDSCEQVYNFQTGQTYLSPECQPLYFEPFNIFDAENNTLSNAILCSLPETPLYSTQFATGGDAELIENLLLCNDTDIFRFYDGTKRGIVFNDSICIPELSSRFSDDRFNPNYITRTDYVYDIAFDFTLTALNRYSMYLYDANGARKIKLSLQYIGGIVYLQKDNINMTSFSGLSLAEVYRLDILLNPTNSALSVKVTDSDGLIIFISDEMALDWTLPLGELIVNTEDASGYSGDGEVFGDYSITSYKMPEFSLYDAEAVALNCTGATSGDYTARYFMTDNLHPDSIANFIDVPYQIGAYNWNLGLINAGSDDAWANGMDDLFGGSQVLKYIFALVVIATLTIASFWFGATNGSPIGGAIVAIFLGLSATGFMVIIGLLPVWILIAEFMIFAIAGAVAFKFFFSGAGDGG